MKAKELVINIPATDNYIHFFFSCCMKLKPPEDKYG